MSLNDSNPLTFLRLSSVSFQCQSFSNIKKYIRMSKTKRDYSGRVKKWRRPWLSLSTSTGKLIILGLQLVICLFLCTNVKCLEEKKPPDNGMRVFKYVSDANVLQAGKPLGGSGTHSQNILPESPKNVPHKKQRRKGGGKKGNKAGLMSGGDPVLGATSVTDRSLIPNSFFAKAGEQNGVTFNTQAANVNKLNASTMVLVPHPKNDSKINGKDKSVRKANNVTNNEVGSESERSRRSPFFRGMPLFYPQQVPMNLRRMMPGKKVKFPGPGGRRRKQQKQKGSMRAPLYMRQRTSIVQLPQAQPTRGVAVVIPPKFDVFPSPSSPVGNILEEPSWNHPMYRRYAKLAKRMQNKVSGLVSGQKRDGYRTDHSKVPFYRPRDFGSGKVRVPHLRGPGHPPPVKYSYPKSAHNIRDILDHFQENEQDNEVYHRPVKSDGSRHPQFSNKERPNIRDRELGRPGPPSIADLSSELKDVRFSLLRDIREFAKRPQLMEEEERDKREDGHIRTLKPSKPRLKHRDDEDWSKRRREDPFSPGYNHEQGFDEIFHGKPKPVRELAVKKSSRFRDRELERDEGRIYDDDSEDYRRTRKKDRAQVESPYYSDVDRKRASHSTHSRYDHIDDDSTERADRIRESAHSMPFSSVEIEIERKEAQPRIRRPERDRDLNRRRRPSDDTRERDRDYGRENEDRDSDHYENDRHPRPRPTSSPYPKSIRDKLRDHEREPEDGRYHPDFQRDYENKPVILKRPYESHPPNFWPNFDHNENGYSNPASQYIPPTSPPTVAAPAAPAQPSQSYPPRYANYVPPIPSPTMTPPTFPYGNQGHGPVPPPFQNQIPHPQNQIPHPVNDSPDLPSNIQLGGGTVLRPPVSFIHQHHEQQVNSNNDASSLHKAYLELLQQKMNAEAGRLNGQVSHPPNSRMSPSQLSTSKKNPSPMRMKIHIYPDQNAVITEPEGVNAQQHGQPSNYGQQSNYGQHQQSNYGQVPNLYAHSPGATGSSYSSNTLPIHSPRYPQKASGSLGGYTPAPHKLGDTAASPANSDKKGNQNLVLHLHVHRRNDGNPYEMQAEASEHFISTEEPPPINYRELYDDDEPNPQRGDMSPNNLRNAKEGDGEVDKSVSMEVPIHDDRIEDVLHTILKFRDKKPVNKQ